MSWRKPGRPCLHYSTSQNACRLAGALCGDIPAPCTESDCAACYSLSEPTMAAPNEVVARLVTDWKAKRQVRARAPELPAPPAPGIAAYTEADFPCVHRGEKTGEHQCTECDGGKLHILYDCGLKGRECTVLAAPKARGKDGQHALCCLACDERQAA